MSVSTVTRNQRSGIPRRKTTAGTGPRFTEAGPLICSSMVAFTETVPLPPGYSATLPDENHAPGADDDIGASGATAAAAAVPVPAHASPAVQERPVRVVFSARATGTKKQKQRAKSRSPSPGKDRLTIYTRKGLSELEEESRSSRASSAASSPVKSPSAISLDGERRVLRSVRASAISAPQPSPPERVVIAVLPSSRASTLPRQNGSVGSGASTAAAGRRHVITARRVVPASQQLASATLQDTAPYSHRDEDGTIKLEFVKATPRKPPRSSFAQDPQLSVSTVSLAPPVRVAPRIVPSAAAVVENKEVIHLTGRAQRETRQNSGYSSGADDRVTSPTQWSSRRYREDDDTWRTRQRSSTPVMSYTTTDQSEMIHATASTDRRQNRPASAYSRDERDAGRVTSPTPRSGGPASDYTTMDESEVIHVTSPSRRSAPPASGYTSMSKKETLINGSSYRDLYYHGKMATTVPKSASSPVLQAKEIGGDTGQHQHFSRDFRSSGRYGGGAAARGSYRKSNQENMSFEYTEASDAGGRHPVSSNLSLDMSPVRTSSRAESPFRILQLEDSPQRRKPSEGNAAAEEGAAGGSSSSSSILRKKDAGMKVYGSPARSMSYGSPAKSEPSRDAVSMKEGSERSERRGRSAAYHSTPSSAVTSPVRQQGALDEEEQLPFRRHASLPRRFGSKNFRPRHHEVKITSVRSTVAGSVIRQGHVYPRHFNAPMTTTTPTATNSNNNTNRDYNFERASKSDDDLPAPSGSSVLSDDGGSVMSEPTRAPPQKPGRRAEEEQKQEPGEENGKQQEPGKENGKQPKEQEEEEEWAPSAREIRAKLEKLSLEGRLGMRRGARAELVEGSGVVTGHLPSVRRVKRDMFVRELEAARTKVMTREKSPVSPRPPVIAALPVQGKPRGRVSQGILRLQTAISGHTDEEVLRKQIIKQSSMEVAREALRRRENIRHNSALLEARMRKEQA